MDDMFKVCKSVQHRTIHINHQPDATVFQFIILTFICSRPARPRTQHDCHHDTKVKPEAATAVIELLMMGGKTPETCWTVNRRQDNKLKNCCIWLLIYLNGLICIATKGVQHFARIVLVLPPLVDTCCNRCVVLEVLYSVWRDECVFCFVPGFIYQYPSWNLYFCVHSWLFVFHDILPVEVCFSRVSVWLRILFDFLVWAENFPWA
jgi:hypothetical protein